MACEKAKLATYEVYEYDAAAVAHKTDKRVEFDLTEWKLWVRFSQNTKKLVELDTLTPKNQRNPNWILYILNH